MCAMSCGRPRRRPDTDPVLPTGRRRPTPARCLLREPGCQLARSVLTPVGGPLERRDRAVEVAPVVEQGPDFEGTFGVAALVGAAKRRLRLGGEPALAVPLAEPVGRLCMPRSSARRRAASPSADWPRFSSRKPRLNAPSASPLVGPSVRRQRAVLVAGVVEQRPEAIRAQRQAGVVGPAEGRLGPGEVAAVVQRPAQTHRAAIVAPQLAVDERLLCRRQVLAPPEVVVQLHRGVGMAVGH